MLDEPVPPAVGMRSTARTSGCGCGASSTACASTTGRASSCWPGSTRAGPAGCSPRRSIPKRADEPAELAFYVCAGPAETTLAQLITVAGGRWRVEECFQGAKNEAGLASCQVRDYTA